MIGSDACTAAVMGPNGSVVLAGMTKIMWNGTHTGGYLDFAAIKLDSSGQEVWRWKVRLRGGSVCPLEFVEESRIP